MTTDSLLKKKNNTAVSKDVEKMRSKIVALLALILFYIVVPFLTIYVFYSAITTKNLFMVIPAIAYLILSLFIWLRKVEYSGRVLSTIRIEEAPQSITELLSETTNRGVLINQLIIKTINEYRGISQTELYQNLGIPDELCPTKERVRQYALILEKEGIIKDVSSEIGEGKKRVYMLTGRGEWCVSAINYYYPAYSVFYLVRGILRTKLRKKLPSFDSITN